MLILYVAFVRVRLKIDYECEKHSERQDKVFPFADTLIGVFCETEDDFMFERFTTWVDDNVPPVAFGILFGGMIIMTIANITAFVQYNRYISQEDECFKQCYVIDKQFRDKAIQQLQDEVKQQKKEIEGMKAMLALQNGFPMNF